jgi:hypothetical protein
MKERDFGLHFKRFITPNVAYGEEVMWRCWLLWSLNKLNRGKSGCSLIFIFELVFPYIKTYLEGKMFTTSFEC